MGFSSFLGRVLFASLFILSAWQILETQRFSANPVVLFAGFSLLGFFLFFNYSFGNYDELFNEFDDTGGSIAKELIPKLTVLRRNWSSKLGVEIPTINVRQVIATIIFLKGVGGILFVFGSTFGAYLLLWYLGLTTPILYDFYNYRPNNPEYSLLLNDFIQSTALFGALLFFIGMKYSIPRKQFRKKTPKPKTN